MGLPTFSDVRQAAERLSGVAHRTPVLTSTRLDDEVGAEVYLKCENFQRVGAFKFRGAYNALAQLTPEERERGVVAFSSGNHAQAVALAARLLEVSATIVMPTDAPALKLAATKGYGATVVPFDRYREDREAIGAEISRREGRTVIPPFNHPAVIAGQGTAALELYADAPALDALFVPLGGGGLLSGTTLTSAEVSAGTALFGVEPEAGDDARRSLQEGRIVRIDTPQTIADGAQTQSLGELTFSILREHGVRVLTASDDELTAAMLRLAETLKIVVEPTGCLGLAALLSHREEWAGKRVGVLVSGGNVDPLRYAELLRGAVAARAS